MSGWGWKPTNMGEEDRRLLFADETINLFPLLIIV